MAEQQGCPPPRFFATVSWTASFQILARARQNWIDYGFDCRSTAGSRGRFLSRNRFTVLDRFKGPPDQRHAHPRTKMDLDTEHHDNVDDGETSPCPLFMDSLPKNFAENPSLAALASLLDDDIGDNDSGHCSSIASPQIRDEDNSKQECVDSSLARNRFQSETRQGGGGKVHFPKSRHSRTRQTQPYPNARIRDASASKTPSKRDPVKPEATLGEAQLFLKLWKL
jgi:hypothetical protein